MRVAHISDLHVLALAGAVPFRLFNKRATGYANLRFRRKHEHKSEIVRATLSHLAKAEVDHVVVTGDVSNLALESEFSAVRRAIDELLGLPASAVTLVPGNHDVYTRGAQAKKRFVRYFEPYVASDLPEFATDQPGGPFPIVRLRGPLAIIGLSSAMARLPFVAAGRVGRVQLEALKRILSLDEVRARTPIVLLHHPIFNPPEWSPLKARLDGLEDAGDVCEALNAVPRGLFLHGHLHRRVHRRLPTKSGHLDVIGATSASLVHESPSRMAGYNLYEFDASGGLKELSSYVYRTQGGTFVQVPLPYSEQSSSCS